MAERVFDDPLAISRVDHSDPREERWQTLGMPDPAIGVLLLVVHTWPRPTPDGLDEGRIISVRKATSHERRQYEEGSF